MCRGALGDEKDCFSDSDRFAFRSGLMIRGKTLHATNLIGANAGASKFIDENLRVLKIQAVSSYADTPEPRSGPPIL